MNARLVASNSNVSPLVGTAKGVERNQLSRLNKQVTCSWKKIVRIASKYPINSPSEPKKIVVQEENDLGLTPYLQPLDLDKQDRLFAHPENYTKKNINHYMIPRNFDGLILGSVGKDAKERGFYWPDLEEIRQKSYIIKQISETVKNQKIKYPEDVLKNFHGYPFANFTLLSVFQQESAMQYFPVQATGGDRLAGIRQRRKTLEAVASAIQDFQTEAKVNKTRLVVDMGCGVGGTTRVLAHTYYRAVGSSVVVCGLDISPMMLAMAKYVTHLKDEKKFFSAEVLEQFYLGLDINAIQPLIHWLHADARNVPLRNNTADVATFIFSSHEQTKEAMQLIVKEAFRFLKPGGCFAVIDIGQDNEKVMFLRGLSDGLLKLINFITREPHIDDYLKMDFQKILSSSGYTKVHRKEDFPKHTFYMAEKPQSEE